MRPQDMDIPKFLVLATVLTACNQAPLSPDAALDAGPTDGGADTGTRVLCEVPPVRRESCVDDMHRFEFVRPFERIVVGVTEGTTEARLRRFVEVDTSELQLCNASSDEWEVEANWDLWANMWTTNVVYRERLSTCDEFNALVGDQFETRLRAATLAVEQCLFASVFPDRDDYAQRLRDAGTFDEMSYFLMGLTPELSSGIPGTCTNVECAASSLFGSRAEAVLRIYRDTGYVLQDWGLESEPWELAEIELMEDALGALLDCDRFGGTYQFEHSPIQHLRTNSVPADAGFDGVGLTVSRYFMYDDSGAPTPERLRFVLGHELAHAASDEIGYRRGFDHSVFGADAAPDPEQYLDPGYIDDATRIANLERDLLIVGGARHPLGFREADLESGALNPLIFSQPRFLPFSRNPPVVAVDDMHSESPTYYDGLVRSENGRGYREIIADLIVGYAEFPSMFFHEGLFIAPRGYFFVRDNFFDGRPALGLTPEQQAEVDRYDGLTLEERHAAHQIDASLLRDRYCAANPAACVRRELPVPADADETQLFDRLTSLSVRGREARLSALRAILDGSGLPYTEEMTGDLVNIVITLGSGPQTITLGGHWDGYRSGRGAIDNASGVVSLIEVAQRLSATPVAGTTRVVFFDREETGLEGSSSFVNSHLSDLPPLYVNLDMCGYGDTILVGPTAGATDLLPWVRSTATSVARPIAEFAELPGGSDHESFLSEGVPALSLSMMSATDVALLERLQEEDFRQLAPLLQVIHTQDDSLHRIEPAALVGCADFVEALVRSIP